ncbi:uncharacterized protein (DUF2345 family), partial [Oxalobacteraceae bacterium GrIS 1.11]
QYNLMGQGGGAATGNAPAWFPGLKDAHAHPAVLSGFKSQAMQTSQNGGGAYSQLVFDDSPGQSRLGLQRHASPHQGTAELNLGHLRQQSDNRRLAAVGFGAELKTEHSGAIRAGQGLLLSSDARSGASGSQLDTREAQAQIEQSHALQASMATTAQKHNAMLKDDKGQSEPAPEKLPAIAQMANSLKVVESTAGGGVGQGQVTAYSEAQLQLSSPAGIAATTPAHAILAAGQTGSITAGQDINFAAQGNHYHAVKAGISLFTYGKASSKDKPNQETGIKLHAASGKVSSQSQSDETKLTADKAITVASITKSVTVAAKEYVMLTAQGAYLKLEGGNIMIHGPGKMEFKASMKEWAGPAMTKLNLPEMPKSKLYAGRFKILDNSDKNPMSDRLYRKQRQDGKVFFGRTDQDGHTQEILTAEPENIKIVLDADEKFHRQKLDDDDINIWFSEK